MSSITIAQIKALQYSRATLVTNEQLKQCKRSGEYCQQLCMNAHAYAQKERLRCWPRGKSYYRVFRRDMNPHINFSVNPTHPDRGKHMENRMWC